MVQGKGLNDSSTRLVFLNRKLESNEDTIIDADVLYFRSMGTLDSVVSGTPGPVEFTIQGNNILLPTANNVGLGNAQS